MRQEHSSLLRQRGTPDDVVAASHVMARHEGRWAVAEALERMTLAAEDLGVAAPDPRYRDGGSALMYAKRVLAGVAPDEVFEALCEAGRSEATLEYAVLTDRLQPCFEPHELRAARRRLVAAGVELPAELTDTATT